MIPDTTAEKAQDMLLEDKRKQAEKNSNKALNATALANCNSDNQGQEAGRCQYCHNRAIKKIYAGRNT